MRGFTVAGLLTLFSVLAASCDYQQATTLSEPFESADALLANLPKADLDLAPLLDDPEFRREYKTLDDAFAEVARRVPEFGGLFIDRNGSPKIHLLDTSSRVLTRATSALQAVFGNTLPSGQITAIRGQYSFTRLYDWRKMNRNEIFSVQGVSFLDIDESKNRLRIGIVTNSALNTIQQKLTQLRIPREAVNIEISGPVQVAESTAPTSNLGDNHRPLIGGIKIVRSSGGNCTLGFPARRGSVNGFVTNSHCTNTRGGTEGTPFHQPTISGTSNRIGLEMVDPSAVVTIFGDPYRNSDSAFIRVPNPSGPSSVTISRGTIARPSSLGGSSPFALSSSPYRIVQQGVWVWSGMSLTKVGARTGRTQGVVNGTNCDVCVTDGWCLDDQHHVKNAGVLTFGKGDSGSPAIGLVQLPFPGIAANDIALYGILWGGNMNISDSTADNFWFSDIWDVELELGELSVCAPGFSTLC